MPGMVRGLQYKCQKRLPALRHHVELLSLELKKIQKTAPKTISRMKYEAAIGSQIKMENFANLKTGGEEQHPHKNEQLKNQYNLQI